MPNRSVNNRGLIKSEGILGEYLGQETWLYSEPFLLTTFLNLGIV